MKFLLSIIAILCLVSLAKQEVSYGSCKDFNVAPMTPFDKTKYDDKWLVYSLADYDDSINQVCIVWDYRTIQRGKDNRRTKVLETYKDKDTGKVKNLESSMYFTTRRTGEFTYDIVTEADSEYCKVIETDYISFSVEFSCKDIGNGQREWFVYVMTRQPNPSPELVARIISILKDKKIESSKMRLVSQAISAGQCTHISNN